MRVPLEAAEVDDRPARRRTAGPSTLTRSVGALADLGRRGIQLIALGLVIGGSVAVTVTRDAPFTVLAIASIGLGGYVLGQLHAPGRPGEREIAVERAVLAHERADLNRVQLALALRGSDDRSGSADRGTPPGPRTEPLPSGGDGGPPRRLSLVDLELSGAERADLGLDRALPDEGPDDSVDAAEL